MALEQDKFDSARDLYKRILPALETKVSELKRNDFKYIQTLDIWNFCVQNKWENKKDLRIYEIVDDILNAKDNSLETFVRSNLSYKKLIDRDEINER